MHVQTPQRRRISDTTLGWISFSTLFVVGTDTFLVAPLLPELRQQFGVGVEASGWMVSAYALGYALCALIAGPMSDQMDRRQMLLAGMAAFSVLTACCGFAWGFWPMIVLRFLTGIAAALATPQIWAAIPQLVAPAQVVRTMGKATAGLSIAQMIGIPLGAFLAAISWRASFIAIGLASAVVTGMLVLAFPHVTTAKGSQADTGYRAVFSSRRLVVSLCAYFVFQTGNFAALSFFGSWFSRDFSLDTAGIGTAMLIIGAGNALGSLYGHRLVSRWGNPRSLVIGILAMSAGYACIVITTNLPVGVALLAIIMACGGFVFPVMMATLQGNAGNARGTVSSLSNVAMYGGTTIGAAIAGPLFAHTSQFSGVGSLALAAFLAALRLFHKAK